MKKEKTPAQEKTEFIQKFSEALEKHCTDQYDLESVLISILEFNEYMAELSSNHPKIVGDVRIMKMAIEKDHKDLLDEFDGMTETFIEGIIIANMNHHGFHLLYKMSDDLQHII